MKLTQNLILMMDNFSWIVLSGREVVWEGIKGTVP